MTKLENPKSKHIYSTFKWITVKTDNHRNWLEAMNALNTLIGYCVRNWLEVWEYETNDLLDKIKPYVCQLKEDFIWYGL